jgi:hypothetical protein
VRGLILNQSSPAADGPSSGARQDNRDLPQQPSFDIFEGGSFHKSNRSRQTVQKGTRLRGAAPCASHTNGRYRTPAASHKASVRLCWRLWQYRPDKQSRPPAGFHPNDCLQGRSPRQCPGRGMECSRAPRRLASVEPNAWPLGPTHRQAADGRAARGQVLPALAAPGPCWWMDG